MLRMANADGECGCGWPRVAYGWQEHKGGEDDTIIPGGRKGPYIYAYNITTAQGTRGLDLATNEVNHSARVLVDMWRECRIVSFMPVCQKNQKRSMLKEKHIV